MIPDQPKLTDKDQKYWGNIPSLINFINGLIHKRAKVLELGGGRYPFKRANTHVDSGDWPHLPGAIKLDMNDDKLPFPDKSFDFIYCRHMLEDMHNPFNACKEMSRVGKAGYIETPSPMAEMTRGIDGGCPDYRGYHHHHWIIWEHESQLHFIAKFPLVEYLKVEDQRLVDELKINPGYWNTYYLWNDNIKMVRHHNPPEFHSDLTLALNQSQRSTVAFWSRVPQPQQGAA